MSDNYGMVTHAYIQHTSMQQWRHKTIHSCDTRFSCVPAFCEMRAGFWDRLRQTCKTNFTTWHAYSSSDLFRINSVLLNPCYTIGEETLNAVQAVTSLLHIYIYMTTQESTHTHTPAFPMSKWFTFLLVLYRTTTVSFTVPFQWQS